MQEIIPQIISFIVLLIIFGGFLIFIIHRFFIANTETAVVRLQKDIEKTNAKQAELAQKLKEADDELEKRRTEAKELADKMRNDAEEQTKAEREKIVSEARTEGEEIIAKAQGATQKLRIELEKEIDMRAVEFGVDLVNQALSEKSKGALDEVLISEFIESLKNTDLSRIDASISSVDVVTINPLNEAAKGQLSQVFQEKLGRQLTINNTSDAQIGGGVVIKFGTMALDGSIKNTLKVKAKGLQTEVEAR